MSATSINVAIPLVGRALQDRRRSAGGADARSHASSDLFADTAAPAAESVVDRP